MKNVTTAEVLRISATLAFRVFLQKSERKESVIAEVMGLTPSSFSRTVNFQRDLNFVDVVYFLDHVGVSLNDMADLTQKIRKEMKVIQQVEQAKSLDLRKRKVIYKLATQSAAQL